MVNINEDRCVMCGEPIPEGRMACYKCEDVEPSFDTIKFWISLNKISDISEFVRLASMCQDDVVVKSGNFSVNAKSIMGLYSLDLTKPVKVEIYGKAPHKFEEEIKKFIIN